MRKTKTPAATAAVRTCADEHASCYTAGVNEYTSCYTAGVHECASAPNHLAPRERGIAMVPFPSLHALRAARPFAGEISRMGRSSRFHLALSTYAPCGARVVRLTKSRNIHTRKILPPLDTLTEGSQSKGRKRYKSINLGHVRAKRKERIELAHAMMVSCCRRSARLSRPSGSRRGWHSATRRRGRHGQG